VLTLYIFKNKSYTNFKEFCWIRGDKIALCWVFSAVNVSYPDKCCATRGACFLVSHLGAEKLIGSRLRRHVYISRDFSSSSRASRKYAHANHWAYSIKWLNRKPALKAVPKGKYSKTCLKRNLKGPRTFSFFRFIQVSVESRYTRIVTGPEGGIIEKAVKWREWWLNEGKASWHYVVHHCYCLVYSRLIFINTNLYNCSFDCYIFILCRVFIMFAVLCAVFCLIVVLFCVMCVMCVLCLIVVPLPPGKNPFVDLRGSCGCLCTKVRSEWIGES
jgi:hypothetical protein